MQPLQGVWPVGSLTVSGGIPVALYTDRHGTFRDTPGSGATETANPSSRAMDELEGRGYSPMRYRRGRVERTAENFQDRLGTETHLAGTTTIKEANAVLRDLLPDFNQRSGASAQCAETAFHLCSCRCSRASGRCIVPQHPRNLGSYPSPKVESIRAKTFRGSEVWTVNRLKIACI